MKSQSRDHTGRSSSRFSDVFYCASGGSSSGNDASAQTSFYPQWLTKTLYNVGAIDKEEDLHEALNDLGKHGKTLAGKVKSAVRGGVGTCHQASVACREVTPTKQELKETKDKLLAKYLRQEESHEQANHNDDIKARSSTIEINEPDDSASLVAKAIQKRERLLATATDRPTYADARSRSSKSSGDSSKQERSHKGQFDHLVQQVRVKEMENEVAVAPRVENNSRIISIHPVFPEDKDIVIHHRAPTSISSELKKVKCHSNSSLNEVDQSSVKKDRVVDKKKTMKDHMSPRRRRRRPEPTDIPKVVSLAMTYSDDTTEDEAQHLIPSNDRPYRSSDECSLRQYDAANLPKSLGQRLICRSRKQEEEERARLAPSTEYEPYGKPDRIIPEDDWKSEKPFAQRLLCRSVKEEVQQEQEQEQAQKPQHQQQQQAELKCSRKVEL